MTPPGGFDRAAFAARLSAVLADSAPSTRDIENATKVSRTTLAAWKAGKRSPHLDHLAALTAFLEVDLAWVLFGDQSADEPCRVLEELRQGVTTLSTALAQVAAEAEALAER